MEIHGKEYRVRDLMRDPVLIQKGATLREALATLVEKKSNIACVVDEAGVFIGGISTLDIIREVLPDYVEYDPVAARFAHADMLKEDANNAAKVPVENFVDTEEATVAAETGVVEASVITAQENHGRIVVLDENKRPVGLLTRTEIKRVIAAFLEIENDLD
jgi:CBS domain-containing protein